MTTKDTKMAVGVKLQLKSIHRSRCAKCNTVKTYLNPVARCRECKKKFCYDHIWIRLFKKGMKNEEGKNVCDECKEKHGYY